MKYWFSILELNPQRIMHNLLTLAARLDIYGFTDDQHYHINMNVAACAQAQRLERVKQYPAFRIVSGHRLFEERSSVVLN